MIQGLNTNYIMEGEGDTILLLHGWGANISLFQSVIQHLKPYFRVVALDLPGFGATEEPKEAWGVQEFTAFVQEFLSVLQIDKAILMGHSFGGRIIIKMMADENRKLTVPKIVLIDSAGVLPKKKWSKQLRVRFYKVCKWIVTIKPIQKIFPGAMDQLRRKFGSQDYKNASDRMRQCLSKVVQEDLQPLFALNKAETLLVWGENDYDTPVSDAKIMESLMPNAGLVVLKNAGHFSYLDQSYTFRKVLSSYLEIKEA